MVVRWVAVQFLAVAQVMLHVQRALSAEQVLTAQVLACQQYVNPMVTALWATPALALGRLVVVAWRTLRGIPTLLLGIAVKTIAIHTLSQQARLKQAVAV